MWRNWSGEQRCEPAVVERPRDVEEAVAAVTRARDAGRPVRVAGSGHSFTDAVCTPGTLVRLDRMRRVLDVDRERGVVRVEAGCTLGEVSAHLAEQGMALRNLGDIDRQTVAGAVATGTHGTGLSFKTLADEVVAVELVAGDGSVRTCSLEDDEDAFRSAQVALGALGIVTSLTLRCEPSYRLHLLEEPRPLEELLDGLDELAEAHEHFELFAFPYADDAIARFADRTDRPAVERGAVRAWAEDVLLDNHVFGAICAAGRAVPPAIPALNRFVMSVVSRDETVRDSHAALVSQRLVRFVEMEWALPREAAATAVRQVRALVHGRRLRVSFPIELRFGAADDAFLSPAYGRESCFVAVHVYRGTPWQPYFLAVERIMDELGGRPHWGKRHFQTFETLRPRYPGWDRFQAVRARLDPEGRFRNAYTDRVLGVPAGVAEPLARGPAFA